MEPSREKENTMSFKKKSSAISLLGLKHGSPEKKAGKLLVSGRCGLMQPKGSIAASHLMSTTIFCSLIVLRW